MKKIVILGAGTAGTMMANKLRKTLERDEWQIIIIDKYRSHYYQPGFLFIPFGIYAPQDVVKPKIDFIPPGVEMMFEDVDKIEGEKNHVVLKNGNKIAYDLLIIATGTQIRPDETPGLMGENWYKSIFDFYTIEGATALRNYFRKWEGGKLVINIAELPFKCPVAPLEFAFLADEYFTKIGIRDKVDISYVTPLSGALNPI
jgi:sulfide:quinone oxidoreductase